MRLVHLRSVLSADGVFHMHAPLPCTFAAAEECLWEGIARRRFPAGTLLLGQHYSSYQAGPACLHGVHIGIGMQRLVALS